jgi:hypothetical protein
MDRRCDGFQGVRYRKVTSRVNEGGVRLGDRRGEAMETRKSGFGIIIAETRGMYYRHNLAGSEGGLRAR